MTTESDIWLEENKTNMFFCKHYNVSMTFDNCLKRREIDKSSLDNNELCLSKCGYCSGYSTQLINFSPMKKIKKKYIDYDGSDFPLDEAYKLYSRR